MKRTLHLIGLTLGLATTALALATPPSFESWSAIESDGALDGRQLPFFWDVSEDGSPDLIFGSINGLVHASFEGEAGWSTAPLTLSPSARETLFVADQEAGVDTRALVFATLDVDGDGREELFVVGREASIWRLSAPLEVDTFPIPLPALRARGVNDAAVGDLNRDGLPDLYLALGTAYPERLNLSGRPDLVLMNRGEGRFEAIEVSPTRHTVTNGVTLVDIDQDGWLDAIESVDASTVAGPSRLLFNRTQPGDRVPSFEPSEHRWDPGTDGMGLAAGDLDQDGHIDLYNTSIGHDLLVMGQGEGRFLDETFTRGILHEWSQLGLRIQWSPSFVDLNLDGRLDIAVRHGVTEQLAGSSATYSWASDLIYTQGDDGRFSRVQVPSQQGKGGGRNFVLGDVDGDGRPDLARDGTTGDSLVWRNVSALPPTTPAMSVQLKGSASGSPAIGARVEGSCAETRLVRHLTSGGKMGANPANLLFFAWPGCAASEVILRVTWPSGALSEVSVDPGAVSALVEEPRWFERESEGTLRLDPTGTGANEACVKRATEPWSCCSGPCEREVYPQGLTLVRLDDHAPMALPSAESTWLWRFDPALSQPSSETRVTLIYLGPAVDFPGEALTLSQGDDALPWDEVDTERRTLSATLATPSDAGSLTLTLREGDESLTDALLPLGYVFDQTQAWVDLYPVRTELSSEAPRPWEAHLHPAPGVYTPSLISTLALFTEDGFEIPIASRSTDGAMRRVSLSVDWEELAGLERVWLRDHSEGLGLELPVYWPSDDAESADLVEDIRCGAQRSRIQQGGYDATGVIVSVYGAGGHPMLLPSERFSVEIEGGFALTEVMPLMGISDMFLRVRSGDEPGQGKVSLTDTLSGETTSCHFEVGEIPSETVSLEDSWATLSRETVGMQSFESTRLRVGVLNTFGELMGEKAWPGVILTGGEWASPLLVTDGGTLSGDIQADGTRDTLLITLTLDNKVFQTFELAVIGLPQERGGESTPPGAPEDEDGCASGSHHWGGAWTLLLLLAYRATRRRMSREGLPGSDPRLA